MPKPLDVHDLHMNTHKLYVNTPHKFNLFSTVLVKLQTTNNKLKKKNNGPTQKHKDWPAPGEVKTGMVAEGGPEDEASADRTEEEEAFGVEPRLHKMKKTSVQSHTKSNMKIAFIIAQKEIM